MSDLWFDPEHRASRDGNPMLKIVIAMLLFLTTAVGFLLAERLWRRSEYRQQQIHREVQPRGDLASDEAATVELFQRASNSVVHVTTLRQARRMFSSEVIEQGSGSGFVWDELGHIVTNFHVVEGSDGLLVTFADQSTVRAEPVGIAPHKDLAVLKVSPSAVKSVPIGIGESDNLLVGQKVFAIGNPFGLDQTLTTGVISGLGREIRSKTDRPIQDVVQTDAAINPGNSGGALLDSAGRLIGVNTAIYSRSGANDGIGFAIPVDTVRRVVPQLIQHGRVMTPTLGVQWVAPSALRQVGIQRGLIVRRVLPSGPAARAGILPFRLDEQGRLIFGDLILEIGGMPINSLDDYYAVLDKLQVGQQVAVRLIRAPNTNRSRELTVPVELGLE